MPLFILVLLLPLLPKDKLRRKTETLFIFLLFFSHYCKPKLSQCTIYRYTGIPFQSVQNFLLENSSSGLFIFLKMCPMRFLLVFFSAILAGYMAWRTVRSTPDGDQDDSRGEKVVAKDKQQTNLLKMMQNGFWVFVDMASGRYLWKNLRDINKID